MVWIWIWLLGINVPIHVLLNSLAGDTDKRPSASGMSVTYPCTKQFSELNLKGIRLIFYAPNYYSSI